MLLVRGSIAIVSNFQNRVYTGSTSFGLPYIEKTTLIAGPVQIKKLSAKENNGQNSRESGKIVNLNYSSYSTLRQGPQS